MVMYSIPNHSEAVFVALRPIRQVSKNSKEMKRMMYAATLKVLRQQWYSFCAMEGSGMLLWSRPFFPLSRIALYSFLHSSFGGISNNAAGMTTIK